MLPGLGHSEPWGCGPPNPSGPAGLGGQKSPLPCSVEIGVVFTAEVLRAGIGLLGLGILDSVELVCMGVATPFVLEMNLNCATFSMPRMRHILCWTHRMELMLANTLVTKPAWAMVF